MPSIKLTNNSNLNFTASSADDNATLNRYLASVVTFKTPPSFDAIANLLVKDQHELDFPIKLSAAGEVEFAVGKTTLDIQLGAAASIGLLQGDDASGFLSSLKVAGDTSSSGVVSFSLEGTLTAGESASVSNFGFGIANDTGVTLTSYYQAAANDRLVDAVEKAVASLTIPHDIDDLKSLPAGSICELDAAGSLQFMASATYSFLNDPLAAVSIANLPSLGINASGSVTLEGTVTHSSDHTLTIAKLSGGMIHLSVSLAKTDDFETSLTVSAGVAANIGSQDALAFLLDRINPNSAAEADAIAAEMKDADQFKSDIKSAIDKVLSASLRASLKAALEHSDSRNRALIYEINLGGLDEDSSAAVQSALKGDFTALTKAGVQLKGIKELDSALTVTATDTHTLVLHFLGIFNAGSIHEFVAKSKVDFTSDTHEIVLSDETLEIVDNNLNAEKLRKLVLKDITLTLPASANTSDVATPLTLAFLDREGSTGRAKMQQFVNVLQAVGGTDAGPALTLLNQNLKNYGVCSVFLGLDLDPARCRRLFVGTHHESFAWPFYIDKICEAERTILEGLADDPENSHRSKLFDADLNVWDALQTAGSRPNMIPILQGLGMSDTEAQLSVSDAITAIWWAKAMAAYGTALVTSQSLEEAGKTVVQDSNLGYNEPWMILAAWKLAGKPPIRAAFSSSLLTTPSAGLSGTVGA